jgi:CheY-like chemotaxis protein
LTAFARGEDRTQALLAGFNVHMSKPVELSELLVSLADLVTHSKPNPAG